MTEIVTGTPASAPDRGAGLACARFGRVVLIGPRTVLRVTQGASAGQVASPFTALVHTREGATSRSHVVSSRTGLAPVLGLGEDVCAIVVPDVLLPPRDVVEAVVPLEDGSLARVSREMTRALCTAVQPGRSPASDTALEDLAVAIVRDVLREHHAATRTWPEDSDDIRRLAWSTIAERHCDPEFAVATLARELHVSRRQLYRRFPDPVGPADLITRYRLSTAARLIREDPALALSDVAVRSGFSGVATMRAAFVARLGVTPAEYREHHDVERTA
ncbi:helix-turn-helix domain-containing protein [Georgenia sp. 311]|uniref:AraC family transcriptional regulator n=1 Tax=Georgenia sp. 311 TaxID=2585134 RepID=UPI0011120A7E|nr:AraC family transcriptional regulator [Georgenia sp. 311]TNC18936.1 helix-turn-helix domain-containing protein [Georgenia sp. 311]